MEGNQIFGMQITFIIVSGKVKKDCSNECKFVTLRDEIHLTIMTKMTFLIMSVL